VSQTCLVPWLNDLEIDHTSHDEGIPHSSTEGLLIIKHQSHNTLLVYNPSPSRHTPNPPFPTQQPQAPAAVSLKQSSSSSWPTLSPSSLLLSRPFEVELGIVAADIEVAD